MALDCWVTDGKRFGVQLQGMNHGSCFADLKLASLGVGSASEAGIRLRMAQVIREWQVDQVEAGRGQLQQQRKHVQLVCLVYDAPMMSDFMLSYSKPHTLNVQCSCDC